VTAAFVVALLVCIALGVAVAVMRSDAQCARRSLVQKTIELYEALSARGDALRAQKKAEDDLQLSRSAAVANNGRLSDELQNARRKLDDLERKWGHENRERLKAEEAAESHRIDIRRLLQEIDVDRLEHAETKAQLEKAKAGIKTAECAKSPAGPKAAKPVNKKRKAGKKAPPKKAGKRVRG
jgi:DNA repair exonuclease SbcCD ATPase subunit